MSNRTKLGLKLLRQSITVLGANKKLIIFPIITTLTYFLLLAPIMFFLIKVAHDVHGSLTKEQWHQVLWLYLLMFINFFIGHQVAFFSNSALINCIYNYFNKKKPKISEGFKTSLQNFGKLFLWNCFSSTAGLVIYLFYSLFKKIRSIHESLLDLSWPMAIQFVLHLITLEKMRPMAALKKSAHLVANTWGTPLVQNIGYGFVIIGIRLISLIPAIVGVSIGGKTNILIGSIVTLCFILFTSSVLLGNRIIITVIGYIYAETGAVPAPFTEKEIKRVFVVRKKSND